jgi:hypothetical protein
MLKVANLMLKIAGAGLAATLVAGGCALMEPKADHYVAPPLGSTHTNLERLSGSYGSGSKRVTWTTRERVWQGERVLGFESPQSEILMHRQGGWIGIVKGDKPLITWDPPLLWDWPLTVGKSWKRDYRMTIHAAKRTIPYQVTQKVEAYESVTVPAGTFKAFKISTSSTLGDENVFWFSPEVGVYVKQSYRRTAKHAQGPGTREIELVAESTRK